LEKQLLDVWLWTLVIWLSL